MNHNSSCHEFCLNVTVGLTVLSVVFPMKIKVLAGKWFLKRLINQIDSLNVRIMIPFQRENHFPEPRSSLIALWHNDITMMLKQYILKLNKSTR